jgi:hypothetical protein
MVYNIISIWRQLILYFREEKKNWTDVIDADLFTDTAVFFFISYPVKMALHYYHELKYIKQKSSYVLKNQ